MGVIRGSASAEIYAPREIVYAVAADGEGMTRWRPEIEVAECLARDSDGNQMRLRVESETSVMRISTTLRCTFHPHSGISWTLEEGDMKSLEGRWTLDDLGGERTRATYELEVDPGRLRGLAVRGPVVDLLRRRMVEAVPGQLRSFVEGCKR